MAKLIDAEVKLLLIHLVRDPDVILKAVPKLTDSLLSYMDIDFYICWIVSRDYFLVHNKPIPREIFEIEFVKQVERLGTNIQQSTQDLIVSTIFDYPADSINGVYVIPLLQRWLLEKYTAPALAKLANPETDTMQFLEELQTATKSATLSAVKPTSFNFEALENVFLHQPRYQTNCTAFDMLFEGGIFLNQSYGLLGPTGGGKTTLAQTVACEVALRGKRVAYFSYEETKEQMIPKFLVCALNQWTREELFGNRISQLPLAIQTEMRRVSSLLENKLLLFDMSSDTQGTGGMAEIESIVNDHAAAGMPIDFMVIDYAGLMASRQKEVVGSADETLRHDILRISNKFRTLCETAAITGILVHQVNAQANVSPTRIPHHTDSAECKGFATNLHFCLVLGVQDPTTHVAVLNLSKARNAKCQHIYVKVDGLRCRVSAVDNYVTDNNKFVVKGTEGISTACSSDGQYHAGELEAIED